MARIHRLRQSILSAVPEVCSERARLVTEAYRENEADPMIIRRAKALAKVLREMTIFILPDELIVGNQASKPRSAPVFPEYAWEWIYNELDHFDKRKSDRFSISEECKEELRRILPEWRGRSLYDRVMATQPDEVKLATKVGVFDWEGQATAGEGHIVVDFSKALKQGFGGIVEEAGERLKALDLAEPDSLKKRDFYRAVIIAFEAAIDFARRYAVEARRLASQEPDPQRRLELLEIARVCEKVPARPAESFREAIQTVYFVQLIQQIESNGHSVSLGRFDQYMYEYYSRDIRDGRITREEALELIECFFIKLFTITKLRSASHSRTQSGNPMYQNLVVGGQTPEGTDATNELSYLCLDALAGVRLPEPNFYVRIHDNCPDDFLAKAIEVIKLGFGMPALVNDKVIVPSLMNRGVSLRDALDYSTMGCLEVQVPGKWGYRANGKSKVNFLKILELALNDGRDPATGIQLCPGNGDLSTFKSFDDVIEAWKKQLYYYTHLHVVADNINDLALEELAPNAFCSALVNDCLKRGKSLNEGGAVYDMTSGAQIGVPNVGNALAAIKKLVFEEKLISPGELKDALDSNFEGPRGEEIRQMLLNKAPKYGEDDDYVDSLTREAFNYYCQDIERYKNMRYGRGPIGGNYYPSTVTISANVPAGDVVGATPDGRKAGTPTADGVSPSQGTGRRGPTAVIRSVAKLPTLLVTGGQLLNLRISSNHLNSRGGCERLAALIRSLFGLYGWHVQINTVSTEVLRDAQKHPENYRDLVVRVAGYSALFTELDPVLQEDIISRMEHDI
ncbi:MAG TPA: glycyl radical protein [Firmicutes bacterium]|nr:glycyl radical protein [Bacillota bacterium]